jgi:pyruvate/2-oxoglutarate dehydrogenase complex dihydrolipoamide dehydrogenase (E3) component
MHNLKADIAIIGGGSGGLSVAAGAAQLGARVVLVEKHKMGGDCLNYGCVQSIALIAAGAAAQTMREASRFGVNGHDPAIDFIKVNAHVHDVISTIAPHDSVERFEGLGVRVINGAAEFVGPSELMADGVRIKARRFVIATGSSPLVPPIPGIEDVPYLTNETMFALEEAPSHLIVVGGGPIGLELAQAHRRLGCKVAVLEAFSILPKDDPQAVDVVRRRLHAEGLEIIEGAKVKSIAKDGNGISAVVQSNATSRNIAGTHLLVATGRRPNVHDLGLEAAGIEYSAKGIKVDRRLRTTNKRVFAVGDVAGGYQFTHLASYHAGIVIRNALFNLPAKVDHSAVPCVTYTDPELAHVGLAEAQARAADPAAKAVTWLFEENDRAQTERATEGFVKAVVGKNRQVLGATIVGRHAGELILPWVLAVQKGLKIGDLASIIAPYPTLSEVSKRVAGAWYAPRLFSEKTRWVVRWIQRLP